jgi:hypothetical protein
MVLDQQEDKYLLYRIKLKKILSIYICLNEIKKNK